MDLATMKKEIANYFKTQPIIKAWLFGSWARGEETPLSDVDLLVQYDETARVSLLKLASMTNFLADRLDREVDIVPEKCLRQRVADSVNHDKILIYERRS